MNRVDKTYKDTWERRKILLNGMGCKEYLNSEHWKKVKQKALKRKRFNA
ncbi:MAG: hypothetical protein IIB83_02440 [Bacteroidetes bacterium]|nr:hypothetical protein [Bacteroidota bacterium]